MHLTFAFWGIFNHSLLALNLLHLLLHFLVVLHNTWAHLRLIYLRSSDSFGSSLASSHSLCLHWDFARIQMSNLSVMTSFLMFRVRSGILRFRSRVKDARNSAWFGLGRWLLLLLDTALELRDMHSRWVFRHILVPWELMVILLFVQILNKSSFIGHARSRSALKLVLGAGRLSIFMGWSIHWLSSNWLGLEFLFGRRWWFIDHNCGLWGLISSSV